MRKLIAHNPVRDLDRDDRPGTARLSEPRYLTPAELELLLRKMGDTFRPVAATLAYAGLRASEALGLRWRDLDFEAETITVAGQLDPRQNGVRLDTTKTTASAATVPMLPVLRRELQAHRKRSGERGLGRIRPDALVFQTLRDKPHARRNVLRALTTAAEVAGLNGEGHQPVGLHDLRHSLIANAFEHGADHREVAELARHANARVTLSMYGGLTENGRERAVAKLIEGGFGV
jgi:integrase